MVVGKKRTMCDARVKEEKGTVEERRRKEREERRERVKAKG